MRDRSLSLVERHCEKVVLGAAGVLAACLAWAFLLESPNAVTFDGRSVTPWRLQEVILEEARALERSMQDAEVPPVEVPRYCRRLEELHRGGIFESPDAAGGSLKSRELRLAAAFGRQIERPEGRPAPVRVVTPIAPERPWVITGRCFLAGMAGEDGSADADRAGEREVGWVRIATRFDRERQCETQLAAGYPAYATKVYVAGVEAERQELLASGGSSPWKRVKPLSPTGLESLPTPIFDDVSGGLLNRAALDAAFREVKALQESLARPVFGNVVVGDVPPAPGEQADVADSDEAEDSLTVWVDDGGVEAGKTYRYRVRLWLWNRLVGRRGAVLDASDAARAVLIGEWSQSSEPIKAAPRTHFFVLGPSVGKRAANVEVWRWRRGWWLRKLFTVAVGDAIGGVRRVRLPGRDESDRPIRDEVDFDTGVVLLGLHEESRAKRVADQESGRFAWLTESMIVAVCVHSVDGRVEERLARLDRSSELRKRLREP